MAEPVIYRVTDPEFRPYGRVLEWDASALLAAAQTLEMPEEGARYEPAIPVLEATPAMDFFTNEVYGEMPVQIGCCWGHNRVMNALEWHRDSEINVAGTDFVLILARLDDLDAEGGLDSARCRMFRVLAGETVEVYATSLHFCPCTTDPGGFRCVVVLPRGTNVPLEGDRHADPRLFRRNKWLICHPDADGLVDRGVVAAISGENFRLK